MSTTTSALERGISGALGSRDSTGPSQPAPEPTKVDGRELQLSQIIYKPLSWFRYHDENRYFREVKTERDYADLEALIRKTKAVEPLLVLADGPMAEHGTILRGESRHIVAGRLGFDKLPCRIVLDPLTLEEQQAIIWGDNIGRVVPPEDLRTWMMSRMFPGYVAGGGDTVSPGQPTKAEVAQRMGLSERQVQREAGIARKAEARAAKEGRASTPEDVAAVREEKNAARRDAPKKPSAAPEAPAIVRVRQALDSLRDEADTYRMGESDTSQAKADGILFAVKKIEEALR